MKDNRAAIAISGSHFQDSLQQQYTDKGLQGFVDWVSHELSEGRQLDAGGADGIKTVYDRSVHATKDGRPEKALLDFAHPVDETSSTLLGVYNLEGGGGPIQLIIRVYPADLSGKKAVEAK